VILGLALSPGSQVDSRPASNESHPVATPASMVDQFQFRRAAETYQAPDPAQVEKAYSAVQAELGAGGMSGLARAGLDCFRRLEARPTYGLMDYCIAFDLFGAAQNARLAGGEAPSATSWFGSAGARQLNVAQSIMAAEGDADARLLDLRRIASELSTRRGGPPLIETIPSLPPPRPRSYRAVETAPASDEALAVQVVEPAPPAVSPAVPSPQPRSVAIANGAAPSADASRPEPPQRPISPEAPAVSPEPVELPAPGR
jgi:hypothetical protein